MIDEKQLKLNKIALWLEEEIYDAAVVYDHDQLVTSFRKAIGEDPPSWTIYTAADAAAKLDFLQLDVDIFDKRLCTGIAVARALSSHYVNYVPGGFGRQTGLRRCIAALRGLSHEEADKVG